MKVKSFKAVIFDLDGVITKTAVVHSKAWKEMFDSYLKYRSEKYNEPFLEFTHENDYLPYVDGKPRYKGVADFLSSRNIAIPWGDTSDEDISETICGLGNKKNSVFNEILRRDGVEVYESTMQLIDELKSHKIKLGVASSSKNCKQILETLGILDLFETRVDGIISAQLNLKGKPEPDIFTTACDNLGVSYHKAVVIEDAVSGVQAGKNGKFGMVLGIAREGNEKELKLNGADIVVGDISELGGIQGINDWFLKGLEDDQWSISYIDYNTDLEKSRETLLATGNGFFATRGAMEEIKAGEINYPGCYMTGLYNRRKSKIAKKWIENEDFVNFIQWTFISFRIDNGEWFDPNKHTFEIITRKLDFRTGILSRVIKVTAYDGKETLVKSSRFASMTDPHIAGLSYEVIPLNYSGEIEIKTSIDGNLINAGVERYQELDQHHLVQEDQGVAGKYPYVTVRTDQSQISITVTSKIEVYDKGTLVQKFENHKIQKGMVSSSFCSQVDEHKSLEIKKIISVYNSRDFRTSNTLREAVKNLNHSSGFEEELKKSITSWNKIWAETDVEVTGDRYSQKLLRMHIYHLLITVSPFHKHLDAGIPARGLHGEAYRGHIFWDELYMLPFYVFHFPEIARSVLLYRYRRLDQAREYAAAKGFKGAMYPWQSGSYGREETQILHLNPVSGEWGDDYSSLQRHISIAIAYNIWIYYHFTCDKQFMTEYGAEMFLEICRFWVSMMEPDNNKYSVQGVMGPDEFHEKYPNAKKGGLKNNAYTNIMISWCLQKAQKIITDIPEKDKKMILKKIGLKKKELCHWDKLSEKLTINISKSGVIEQFEGYFRLKDINLDKYQKKYNDIHRMDRILKAEGKSPDMYKISKQADTLMIYYILGKKGAEEVIRKMGYVLKSDITSKNFEYYSKRTSHGSTLSRVVHSKIARMTGHQELSFNLYMQALESDFVDIQGGTTAEGIHAGVMGGTVLLTLELFAGLNWHEDILEINPSIPDSWESIKFKFHFKNDLYSILVNKQEVQIFFNSPENKNGKIFIGKNLKILKNDILNRFVL